MHYLLLTGGALVALTIYWFVRRRKKARAVKDFFSSISLPASSSSTASALELWAWRGRIDEKPFHSAVRDHFYGRNDSTKK